MQILLVEDEIGVAKGLIEGLRQSDFCVTHHPSAETAESAAAATAFDLAVIDLGLPGMDGLELIRRLRGNKQTLPILILTARDGLEDRLRGLDIGADDYLLKPFLLPELLARIRALIRRSRAASSAELRFGPLRLDQGRRTAWLDQTVLELTGREWDALSLLMLCAPKVVAKQKLMESLGHWEDEITPNAVEIYISRLRSKLASNEGISIRTIRGIGYRLECAHGDA